MSKEKNPYAKPDGTAKIEFLTEFLEWEREKELERRKGLSPEELAEEEAADESLQKKMNS